MNSIEYGRKILKSFEGYIPSDNHVIGLLDSLSLRMKKWISSMMDQQTFYVWNTPYNRDLIDAAINNCLGVIYHQNHNLKGNECSYVENLINLGTTKNADYSIFNIISTGHLGLCIRILDKINRVKNLISNESQMQVDEKLDETLRDIFNYLVYFSLILTDTWMTKEEKADYLIRKTSESELGLLSRFLDDDRLKFNVE